MVGYNCMEWAFFIFRISLNSLDCYSCALHMHIDIDILECSMCFK